MRTQQKHLFDIPEVRCRFDKRNFAQTGEFISYFNNGAYKDLLG